jgi:hypothetical protein
VYELDTEGGLLTHIRVTVPIPNEADWPTLLPDPQPGIKLHIDAKLHHARIIEHELRVLQGLLSIYSPITIDVKEIDVKWIPETEDERKKLHLFSHSTKTNLKPVEELYALEFDLVARSVMAAHSAQQLDTELNFYRRGLIDINNDEYIEAIYDFYFVIERQFANGHFRKSEVLKAFRAHVPLKTAVAEVIANGGALLKMKRSVYAEFQKKYGGLSVDDALERIFDIRGFLHHQSRTHSKQWHPEEVSRYEVDALFMQAVTFEVVFALITPHVWNPAVIAAYAALMST